jgi:hypothetical protein
VTTNVDRPTDRPVAGTNVVGWFNSLSLFAGLLYRRHSYVANNDASIYIYISFDIQTNSRSIEIEGLLQYVLNQLVDKNSVKRKLRFAT